MWRALGRPTLFAATGVTSVCVGAALIDKHNRNVIAADSKRGQQQQPPTRRRLAILYEWVPMLASPVNTLRRTAVRLWEQTPPAQQTVYAIAAVNSAVFLLWKVPLLNRVMLRHFTHTSSSGKVYTMATSMFSHMGVFHLGLNMTALFSFSSVVHQTLGREQFMALYLTGGLTSAYVSHVFNLLTLRSHHASMGASGALYAIVVVAASLMPNARVGVLFVPGVSFPIDDAVKGLVCFDLVGAFFRSSPIDHFGHLGGALGGYLFNRFGRGLWHDRDSLLAPLYAVVFD